MSVTTELSEQLNRVPIILLKAITVLKAIIFSHKLNKLITVCSIVSLPILGILNHRALLQVRTLFGASFFMIIIHWRHITCVAN